MQTVLAKIVADKTIWIEARKQQQPLASFQDEAQPGTRHFYDVLQGAHTAFILECKEASSSKGVIRDDFGPARIAVTYEHHASVISALTDEKYFQGSFNFLPIVSQITPQLILCKDFITDPYQVCPARYYQADVCLLMLSALDNDQYRQLAATTHSLEMGVLTGVSNEEEQERAIALGAKIIGVNNRDLCDLSIDLNRTRELASRLGHNTTVIGESGINTYIQMHELSHFTNGSLISSALMAHDNLRVAVRRVLLGENRVCGLTRGQDAKVAYDAGAVYGGLIFVTTSPRCVDIEQVQEMMATTPLQYVGVFHSHDIADVVDKAKVLSLAIVQLHGNGEQLYIDTLRKALPAHVTIQKALNVGETLPVREFQHVDKYVLGNGQGGGRRRFDWLLLGGQSLGNVLLAGGLGTDNCMEAAQAGCVRLDFNSAMEPQPGIKNARLLASAF